MKVKNDAYYSEVKQTVAGLQKIEKFTNQEEQILALELKKLQEGKVEIIKATEEIHKLKEKLQEEVEKSEKLCVNETNILQFIKPSTELQDVWLDKEAKKKSIDTCILFLKKMFESGDIKLDQLLDQTRKLAAKEFMAIYMKRKVEVSSKSQKYH